MIMNSLWRNLGISMLQAIGAGLVVWIWSLVMSNISDRFVESNTLGLLLFPLIFIIVAVLSAGLVLGYPLYLAFKGEWKRVVILISLTLVWLAFFSYIIIQFY
jgi:hypothetical protein